MGLTIESGSEALLRALPRFRVLAARVDCRTGDTVGLGSSGWMVVSVDRGSLLPADCPPEDIARLLRKGAVEPTGKVPAEVAEAVVALDARAAARRAPAPAQSTRDRLSTLLYRAGATGGEFHAELLDALAEFVDERVAAALDGRSSHAASDQ